MSKGFASNPRIALLAGGILLSFIGLGIQLVNLHVIRRSELVRYVDKTRNRTTVETAKRGDILDAGGVKLATSVTHFKVWADPWAVPARTEPQWDQLAVLLGLPPAELRRLLTARYKPAAPKDGNAAPDRPDGEEVQEKDRYEVLKAGVDEATYQLIAALKVPGIGADRLYSRSYPQGGSAAHVIGFVNHELVPATGIEAMEDFFLRGRNGWREIELDARGRELAQFRSRDVPAVNGYSVRLSIDSNIQDMVERELALLATTYSPKKATIVVSDAQTGFILGLGNYPSFDPNEYGKAVPENMKNIAITDVYEPGSVFKIVAASAALEEGKVTRDSMFDVTKSSVMYRGRMVELPDDDHHFDGPIPVSRIISYSSNRGAVRLAMEVGEEKFYDYVRAFGFGQKTGGFPVGGEVAGIAIAPKQWSGTTIRTMPMGHEVAVTVLQMHQAMSVIASDGVMLKPQIVAEIDDADGKPLFRYGPQVVRRVVSSKTARTMADMLMGVASRDGTAPDAAIPFYQVAGKTGTTQKIVDGKYSEHHHVASFVGFFPASAPRVVISVIVDDADARAKNGVAYGGAVAAPAFRDLGNQLRNYLDIRPVADSGPVFAQGGKP